MIVQMVPSGSYKISRKKPEIMQAFLGSCVGVTLCDLEAGIGGLIHLLLPEPPSIDLTWYPEVSAATGMPIFIDELCRQGARKERLQACVAGGALIDPVSQADLTLDIGGRTAEMVQYILQNEKISINQIEVGGCFAYCMILNLTTWQTTIEPFIIPTAKTAVHNQCQPTSKQLDEVIENLIPIPQIALKIIRMIDDEASSFREVSREVLQDQVLSARIIRMCNSVSINHGMKVDSIDKALLRIGEKNLMLLALSTSMENFISQACRGYSLCKGGIFHHALRTAHISSKLAELTGKANPELAYTAGLLHDIGKVILDQYMHSAHPLFYRQLQIKGNDLVVAEKTLFGIAHTDAGYLLALRWGMPDFISETVLHHHEPDKANGNRPLAHLVYVADLMNCRFVVGEFVNKTDSSHLRSSLDALEFKVGNLPLLLTGSSFMTFDAPSNGGT